MEKDYNAEKRLVVLWHNLSIFEKTLHLFPSWSIVRVTLIEKRFEASLSMSCASLVDSILSSTTASTCHYLLCKRCYTTDQTNDTATHIKVILTDDQPDLRVYGGMFWWVINPEESKGRGLVRRVEEDYCCSLQLLLSLSI